MRTTFLLCGLCAWVPAQASRLHSNLLPEPYGHTANVSPHNANSDREWYTEYRWKKGQQYGVQDGAITTQPRHAPIPEHILEKRRAELEERLRNKVQDSSSQKSNQTSTSGAKWEGASGSNAKTTNSTASEVVQAKHPAAEGGKEIPKPAQPLQPAQPVQTKVKAPISDIRSLPKPCGHTSMVHPTNSNRDRKWYTEYRWQPGNEYEAQDGAITEQPQPALRGIKASPINGDPCVPIK